MSHACLNQGAIKHCAVSPGVIRAAGNGKEPFGCLGGLTLPFWAVFDAYHLSWQLQTAAQMSSQQQLYDVSSQSLLAIGSSLLIAQMGLFCPSEMQLMPIVCQEAATRP